MKIFKKVFKNENVFKTVRFGGYVVLLCNVVISYYHCLQLFEELVHFPYEWLYHIGVISLDTVFILSVIVLTESKGRGIPPWMCLIFGLGFTTWSNIRPAIKIGNVEGIAIGISTVLALLLLKIMLTWMERNKHLFGVESGSQVKVESDETVNDKKAVGGNQVVDGNRTVSDKKTVDHLPDQTVAPTAMVGSNPLPDDLPSEMVGGNSLPNKMVSGNETVTRKEVVKTVSTVDAVGLQQEFDNAVETVEEKASADDVVNHKFEKVVSGNSSVGETVSGSSSMEEAVTNKVVSLPDRANGKKAVAGKMVSGNGNDKTVGAEEMVDGNSKPTTGNGKTVDNELVDDEMVVTDEAIRELADIIEIAKQHKRKHGKIGRVKLQKLTGCRQGEARRALKILEQLEKKESEKEKEVV